MAESVRDEEPGCLLYRAARSIDDPDMFLLYEEYVDQAALVAHRETPHFATLIEGTIVPLLEAREREVLVPVLGRRRRRDAAMTASPRAQGGVRR